MSTNGRDAWEKYFNGNENIIVEVKKAAPYYEDQVSSKSVGNLPLKVKVIYQDVYSQHIKRGGNNKIAFQFTANGSVYYSSVDNFRKPGGTSGIGLKPSNFGMQNKTFDSANSYHTALINSLNSRLAKKEIGGELYEYLIELLKYAKSGSVNFNDIQKTGLPWGEINSYFGELAGPLACIS
jgi:hypothetical protein